jgi:hypothetical protein
MNPPVSLVSLSVNVKPLCIHTLKSVRPHFERRNQTKTKIKVVEDFGMTDRVDDTQAKKTLCSFANHRLDGDCRGYMVV